MRAPPGLILALALLASGAAAAPKNELTVLPVAGGDSDIGIGVGYIASFARVTPEHEPYLYRFESAGAISFLPHEDSVELSYLDDYLLVHLPHVVPKKLGLTARVSYTRASTLKFYGIGNASEIEPGRNAKDDYYEYQRVYPAVRLRATFQAAPALDINYGVSYEKNDLEVPPDGKLAETRAGGSAEEQRLVGGADDFSVVTFLLGVAFDTRDDEVSTHRGQFHEARVELAPGGTQSVPHRFGRADLIARLYLPLLAPRLTLATRGVVDLLFGNAPFYELSRFEGSSALGGLRGVRGIPADRYSGKIKLFGSVELRSELFSARFFGKQNTFGLTGFFDAGRVFADYRASPELDGSGLGLKYGAGAGLRLAAGDSFVLRFDVAWSPDADPVGAYLTSGHCF